MVELVRRRGQETDGVWCAQQGNKHSRTNREESWDAVVKRSFNTVCSGGELSFRGMFGCCEGFLIAVFYPLKPADSNNHRLLYNYTGCPEIDGPFNRMQ